MKNNILVIFIPLITISIGFSGCLDNYSNNNENTFSYSFEVNITHEGSKSFEIYIPILITPIVTEDDNNISIIMDRISIEGNALTEIIDTKYGKALKIIGTGDNAIIAKEEENIPLARFNLVHDSDNDGLTADEHGDVKYWFYFNTSSALSIIIHFSQNSFTSIYINAEISNENGWLLVDGRYIEGAP